MIDFKIERSTLCKKLRGGKRKQERKERALEDRIRTVTKVMDSIAPALCRKPEKSLVGEGG
jgi:hypothetical protein